MWPILAVLTTIAVIVMTGIRLLLLRDPHGIAGINPEHGAGNAMKDARVMRRTTLRLGLAGFALSLDRVSAARAALPPVVVWKDAACGCCGGWVHHMRDAGFSVMEHDVTDMAAIKQARHVPGTLWSCHTAVAGGYVLEGHVPAADVKRLLINQPQALGLAVPGMPQSAPGMDQPGEPYEVVLFTAAGENRLYAQH
jgi:hypothetical protein